ncbi:MAG: DUF3800 domain-containing protein [Microbacterium sp.]|nr:DUF3800 domain-containing protein [Microbacterium sp.]
MWVLFVDETNFPPEEGQFFIYGGVAIHTDKLPKLNRKVDRIRRRYDYAPGQSLKFTNQGGADPRLHRAAKRKVLRAVERANGKFFATVVLERVLARKEPEQYVSWAVNAVTQVFHEFLEREDAYGGLMMDRVDRDQVNHALNELADRFQSGLSFPDGYRAVNDRILWFGMTNNNASHLSSCADIVLGAFRYCVNAATGHGNARVEVAEQIAPSLAGIWWRRDYETYPSGFRPHPVRIAVS